MRKLNFGCGQDIKMDHDNLDEKDFDFNIFPYPIKDNTYEHILVKNVLEHLDYPWKVLKELHRILKKGGSLRVISAHHNSEASYNSLQHSHFFNEHAFKEFVIRNPRLFKIRGLLVKPTILGRFFIKPIRDILSRHIGHLKGEIDCEYIKL